MALDVGWVVLVDVPACAFVIFERGTSRLDNNPAIARTVKAIVQNFLDGCDI
jgi:hypothetical protein